MNEYEIHFASDLSSGTTDLAHELANLEFVDDGLVFRGVIFDDRGYAHSCCPLIGVHSTWTGFRREDYTAKRREFEVLMEKFGRTTNGYAHAEVIKPEWDVRICPRDFDSSVVFPVSRFASTVSTQPKVWDIHITAFRDSLDPRLEQRLFEQAGMYFIDIKKPNGRIGRSFTVQGRTDILSGIDLFKQLQRYISAAGGMEGSMKLEKTIFMKVYGDPAIVPPAIDSVEYR